VGKRESRLKKQVSSTAHDSTKSSEVKAEMKERDSLGGEGLPYGRRTETAGTLVLASLAR
jgi:hypothetical protein